MYLFFLFFFFPDLIFLGDFSQCANANVVVVVVDVAPAVKIQNVKCFNEVELSRDLQEEEEGQEEMENS